MFVVINWYTPSYRLVADCFTASLIAHNPNVHCQSYEVDDQGGWANNVLIKPHVLRQAWVDYPDMDLVYIDSDAVVHGPLTLFDEWAGEDFGAHYLRDSELLGGTQYWSNNERMHRLLDDMAARMADNTLPREMRWSQKVLARMLPERPDISIKRLPPEYCCITDISRAYYPGIVPVIEHMQESRRQRK